MTYSQFLEKITPYAEEKFAAFQRKLIFTDRKILGIRTPTLRKIAKECAADIPTLFSYPDEYYETVFIKLTAVASLPYERFLFYLGDCIELIDNWALCDSFRAKRIKKNREEFLPVLEKFFQTGKEYYVRYTLVTLLTEYIQDEYLPIVTEYIRRTDDTLYYVHMALAWLIAEILIKRYERGVDILKSGILSVKTHNKSIQKAIESYRLSKEQKNYLRSLKIKTGK